MQDPKNVKAKVKIGTVFLRGKNYRETQSRYKEAIDLDSNYAPAHKRYGEYLIVGAQYKNAARYLKKYLEKAEATPEATLETAKLLFLSQDYEGAMKYTDEADKKGVKDNDIYRMRGYSNVELKNYQQGIDNLEGMVRSGVKPYYADDLYFGKGYQGLGKDSLALTYLERAAPLDTNNNVFNIIHDIRFKQKRYNEAAKAALQSIEWKQKKNLTIGSGDFDKAALDFYLVAGLTPKTDSLNRVFYAMKADTLSAKAISVNDKWPVFYVRRARINSVIDFSGSKWLSVPYYEKFLETVDKLREEKSTTYKEDKNQLFEAYKYLGGYNSLIVKDDAKAKAYFTKALELKKDDKEVNEYFNIAPAASPAAPAAPKK
jgi:tetratricopeptide (TPR) repeat protein